jgi:peptidoglycan L-alanyl-D-glutamate endopeptidase CwlK
VQQQSKGYVSLLVCPPAGAPTPAGGVDNVLDLLSPALVAQMFPGTPQRDVESNLPSVRKALAEFGLTDRTMVLVALATIRAESSRLASTTETESRFNTSPGGRPFDLYDNRKDVGNQGAPDGERFRGRGFIRLFGRANYAAYGGAIGLGSALIDNPENAADPDIAAKVLAAFLKRREEAIRKAVAEDNLAAVRRMVSGGVTGLAVFTDTYNRGDKLLPKARASDISRAKASAN